MSGRRRSQSTISSRSGAASTASRVSRGRALLDALGHAQQVQVVVAEHRDGAIAQRLHEAQAAERVGAAVHEVAHEPQAVARRVERELVDEPLEGLEAPLQVADRVEGHGREGRK